MHRVLSPILILAALAAGNASGGCQTNTHSQGLLEEKQAGGVNDPYIVRDANQKSAASTQPADSAPTQ